MKLSIDAAALCSPNHFGNYTVTKNLIEAIRRGDKENSYTLYSFCRKPGDLELSEGMRYRRILPKKFWLSTRVSLEELFAPKDIFFALNQALPLWTSQRVFSFAHGLSYYFYKDLYPDSYESLKHQLFSMMDRSEQIFVSSKRVKEEMESVFMKMGKVRVIPFGIPSDMLNMTIDREALGKEIEELPKNFFLYAGVDHPIKNIQFLIDAFTILTGSSNFGEYKLVLAGGDFEKYKGIPYVVHMKHLGRNSLKYLYQKAAGYLTASHYESFNFPIIEALSQGCPVVGKESAVIPELEEYVHTTKTVEEFVEEMKVVASGNARKIPKDELKEKFSWENYILRLQKFYLKQ